MIAIDRILENRQAIAATLPTLPAIPDRRYSIIAIDPPWQYGLREKDVTHRGRIPYPSMSDAEIMALPVKAIAARDAYLLLWATNNHLPLAFECLQQWGFQYKSIHTWLKVTKLNTPHIGVGHYGRNCTEHFLVAVKGRMPSFTALKICNVPNIIQEQRREHSRKPEQFYQLCDRLSTALNNPPRVELFARQRRSGWDVWGAETELFTTED